MIEHFLNSSKYGNITKIRFFLTLFVMGECYEISMEGNYSEKSGNNDDIWERFREKSTMISRLF